ncbi:MAG: MurR/RpiR family transcriptional regulator [bacterium]|nr:MurR/RpiR family transcriptional regulator [bacterium]
MNLFRHEQICRMNESELAVYNYVSAHLREVEKMNIRELSAAVGVSTTTILRFCSRIGCNGYTEFKYNVHRMLEEQKETKAYFPSEIPAIQYLENARNNQELVWQMEVAVELCMKARQVLFIGIGTSGSLGEYGARFFAGVGVPAFAITDPYYPTPIQEMENTTVIALSVSGETPAVIYLIDGYKKKRAKVISITNTNQCTLAKMSDINFSYYMPVSYAWQNAKEANLTTQIPVVYLLEMLMRKIHMKYDENDDKVE